MNEKEQARRERFRATRPHVWAKMQRFEERLRRGEPVGIIQLQYRYQCNLRCQHCSIEPMQDPRGRRSLTPDDVANLAGQADRMGLARFVITGGEPLTFKDLDDVVAAIDPQRHYINLDTNGYLLTAGKAAHLKAIGIDRIQLSIDSLVEREHDAFRCREGSWSRAMDAVNHTLAVGLDIFIQTVVTKQRLYSDEFRAFVEYFNGRGIGVFVTFAKPVGAFAGRTDAMIGPEDLAYVREWEKRARIFTHLTPGYGMDLGCASLKNIFSVTQHGDVIPCPYLYVSLGSIFDEPLQDIVNRGMRIKWFGERQDTCFIAADRDFISKYVEGRMAGKPLPVPCGEVFSEDDRTRVPFNEGIR